MGSVLVHTNDHCRNLHDVSFWKEKMRVYLLLFLLLVAGCKTGLIVAGTPLFTNNSSMISIEGCRSDSDCVIVNDGCCSCESGGKAKAVDHTSVLQWQQTQLECDLNLCNGSQSADPSCSKKARCVNNTCQLI